MKLIETLNSLVGDEKYYEIVKIIKKKYPKFYNEEFLEDVFDWIEKSGVKSIKFENLTDAMGIAHYNRLILDEKTSTMGSLCFFLYVLLHETSHYYQFKKHGEDIEYDIFNNDDTQEIVKNLLNVEIAADRLALMKLRQLKTKYNLNCNIPFSVYKNIKDSGGSSLISYIETVRKEIKNGNIKNNIELVDFVYNLVS
jgi:hypothetical protein